MKCFINLFVTIFLLLFATVSGVCQDSAEHHVQQHRNLPPLPVLPQFPGGRDSLATFIKNHTKYPSAARRHHIVGTIEVDFTVTKDGTLKNPKVLKPLGYGCDEEAIRVVKEMPKWKPGRAGRDLMEIDYHVNIPFGKTQ